MLTVKEEIGLMKRMDHFPQVVLRSAEEMTPHRIAFYLIDLAAAFQLLNKQIASRVNSCDVGGIIEEFTKKRMCFGKMG